MNKRLRQLTLQRRKTIDDQGLTCVMTIWYAGVSELKCKMVTRTAEVYKGIKVLVSAENFLTCFETFIICFPPDVPQWSEHMERLYHMTPCGVFASTFYSNRSFSLDSTSVPPLYI